MNILKRFLCSVFNYCHSDYNIDEDKLVRAYEHLETRVDRLYWKPRNILDV